MQRHTAGQAIVVTDLGFGDQGKGTITDFLARDLGASLVVRYNGGAQAAHRVVCDDGRRHVFAQFGAGTFVPGVRTFLSHHVAISPWNLMVEAAWLARAGVHDAFARLHIAAGAPVITPFHAAANRLRERARGANRHGSCGLGVGETIADARRFPASDVILARDLAPGEPRHRLHEKLSLLQRRKAAELADTIASLADETMSGRLDAGPDIAMLRDESRVADLVDMLSEARFPVVPDDALGDLLRPDTTVVFEGAQGVLLDEAHGFFPWVTHGSCTSSQALSLLQTAAFKGPVMRLGVLRTYATRHGAGPLPTEDPALGQRLSEPDDFGTANPWQGAFRVGWFDMVLARYAIAANDGIDALALTCMDRVGPWPSWRAAIAYDIAGIRHSHLHLEHPGDLAAQAELAKKLIQAIPDYINPPTGHIVATLSEHLAPVALVSSGETASSKTCLQRFARTQGL